MVNLDHSSLFFKQQTAYEVRVRDGSSKVCSSDLAARMGAAVRDIEARDLARRLHRDGRRVEPLDHRRAGAGARPSLTRDAPGDSRRARIASRRRAGTRCAAGGAGGSQPDEMDADEREGARGVDRYTVTRGARWR